MKRQQRADGLVRIVCFGAPRMSGHGLPDDRRLSLLERVIPVPDG